MTHSKLINGSKYKPLSIYIEKCENVKKMQPADNIHTSKCLTEYCMGNLWTMWIGRITHRRDHVFFN